MKAFLALAVCLIFYTACVESQVNDLPLRGGVNPIDPNDPVIKHMVQHGLRILNADVAKDEPLSFVKITSGTEQVVAGTIHELDVVVEVNQDKKNCHFSILDQPWAIGRRFDIKCDHKTFERFTVKSEQYES